MALKIIDRLAQTRIGLHFLPRHLLIHPLLQLRHHRTALLLMISQPLLIAHSRRLLLVLLDFPDLLQHIVTRLRIDSSYLHEFPSRLFYKLAAATEFHTISLDGALPF